MWSVINFGVTDTSNTFSLNSFFHETQKICQACDVSQHYLVLLQVLFASYAYQMSFIFYILIRS